MSEYVLKSTYNADKLNMANMLNKISIISMVAGFSIYYSIKYIDNKYRYVDDKVKVAIPLLCTTASVILFNMM